MSCSVMQLVVTCPVYLTVGSWLTSNGAVLVMIRQVLLGSPVIEGVKILIKRSIVFIGKVSLHI